jgi:hypothetical protein
MDRMTDIAIKDRLRDRINFRLVLLFAVVAAPIAWMMYIFLESEITHGIKDVGGYKQVDLKAMSSFDFNQTYGRLEDVPARWRDLDGQKVILYGEMWAPNTIAPELDQFDLCYSITKCCFSGPPQVQHFVKSRAIRGLLPYYSGLVKVKGTLHVDVKQGEGKIASVYQVDVESVEPAPG